MKWLINYITSSVGQKQVMALTGIGLSLFVLQHAIGHFLLFAQDPGAYNSYSHGMVTAWFVWPARTVLLVAFLFHVYLGIRVTRENRAARKEKYQYRLERNGEGNIASKTMIFTGMALFFWIIWHILTFTTQTLIEPSTTMMVDGIEMRNLYRDVMIFFKSHVNTVLYVVGGLLAGLHVYHGFGSAFQTLGLNHPQITPALEKTSKLLGVFVFISYAAVSIFCHIVALKGGLY